jgi:hypothetical protein
MGRGAAPFLLIPSSPPHHPPFYVDLACLFSELNEAIAVKDCEAKEGGGILMLPPGDELVGKASVSLLL